MNKIILKKYFMFILIILVMGIISGIIYYYKLDNEIKDNIILSLNDFNIIHINNIFKHFTLMAIILILSFFIIGVPVSIFYLFYEGISIGFVFTIFSIKYGFSGFIYAIIFNLFTKFIFIFVLTIFIKKIYIISKVLILNIIITKNNNNKNIIITKFKSSLILILIVFISDIIIYFTSESFLSIFNSLLN